MFGFKYQLSFLQFTGKNITIELWSNASYIWPEACHYTLVQVMACHLLDAKLLSALMLIIVDWNLIQTFSLMKIHLPILSAKWWPFCSGLNVFNSLCPNNAIWWHRSSSTVAQVMACCLMPPSHYLNPCWLIIIRQVLWHSSKSNFTSAQTAILYDKFENYALEITTTSLKAQWGKWICDGHLGGYSRCYMYTPIIEL